MVQTPSTMVPLGMEAPPFSLPEPATGRTVSLGDFADAKGLLVMFLSNHCPFVKHVRAELADFGREYGARGLAVVGINCNDAAGYPADSPEKMAEEVALAGYSFPYLFDESQEVGRAYSAACTPDFFLFDADQRLVYRGQLDGSRPSNGVTVTGEDLRRAADEVLAGQKPDPAAQRASVGCNIKWRPGNEPDYFG